jgi:hypothetical protein
MECIVWERQYQKSCSFHDTEDIGAFAVDLLHALNK